MSDSLGSSVSVGAGVAVEGCAGVAVRTAIGAGVGLVEMTAVLAGVMVTGVATSESMQAAMLARVRRDRRVRANCRVIALFRLVQGVDGEDV